MNCCNYILYKIYYGDELVYIGRTKQALRDRLRAHFFHTNKIVKQIDFLRVTKVEYSVLNTEADMFLYEIYLINYFHPKLNVDDNAKDNFSDFIQLPELPFYEYKDEIFDKWKDKYIENLIDTSPLGNPFEDDFYF